MGWQRSSRAQGTYNAYPFSRAGPPCLMPHLSLPGRCQRGGDLTWPVSAGRRPHRAGLCPNLHKVSSQWVIVCLPLESPLSCFSLYLLFDCGAFIFLLICDCSWLILARVPGRVFVWPFHRSPLNPFCIKMSVPLPRHVRVSVCILKSQGPMYVLGSRSGMHYLSGAD